MNILNLLRKRLLVLLSRDAFLVKNNLINKYQEHFLLNKFVMDRLLLFKILSFWRNTKKRTNKQTKTCILIYQLITHLNVYGIGGMAILNRSNFVEISTQIDCTKQIPMLEHSSVAWMCGWVHWKCVDLDWMTSHNMTLPAITIQHNKQLSFSPSEHHLHANFTWIAIYPFYDNYLLNYLFI